MKRIIRVSILLFLAAVLFIPILPSSAQGQAPAGKNEATLKTITSNLNSTQAPKNVIGKESVHSYANPYDYPYVDKGQEAGTLIDSYDVKHSIKFDQVQDISKDKMGIRLYYTSEEAYDKDPIVTVEFYKNVNGTMQFVGSTDFDTSGYTKVYLTSNISKSKYSSDPYIFIRLGVSSSVDDPYFSDVIQFQIANPFYNSIQPRTNHVVLISNESTDPDSLESTGNLDSFKMNADNDAAKNSNAIDYKIDYVKPFNKEKLKNKLIRKSLYSIKASYEIGDSKSFWVSNLETDEYYQISAKLLYSGTHSYIWVYDNKQITQNDAAKLGKEFDERIYPLIHQYFGQESDVNGDGKINILCYDIQDGFDGEGGYVAGYFDPNDLSLDEHSNHSEIFYIDTYPLMGTGSKKDVTKAYDTLAHEFQHMVNFNENVLIENKDPMDTWLDEGLSMAAEQIYLGKALNDRIDYYNQSESIAEGHSLLNWDYYGDTLANYSLSYLFVQYLKIQAGQGNNIFKDIIDDTNNNYKAVEDIIKKYINPNLSFGQFMTDFREALLLKNKTGLYGFKSDPAFDALRPRVFNGTETYLYGGGALVKPINSPDTFRTPADKGSDVTYTMLTIDLTPPAVPKINPVSNKDTIVTGTAEIGANVYVKIGSKVYSSKADGAGKFKTAIAKQKAGTKLISYVKDAAGNKSGEVTVTVSDKTPPAKPTVSTVGDNQLTISGKAEPGATVYVKTGSKTLGKVTASSKGTFSLKLKSKLKAGTVLTVYAIDKAGNKSASATVKVVDKTPPKTPSVNTITSKTTYVTGKGEYGSTVYVYYGSHYLGKATVQRNGTFKVKIAHQKKGRTLKIYAKDKAGNRSAYKYVKVK